MIEWRLHSFLILLRFQRAWGFLRLYDLLRHAQGTVLGLVHEVSVDEDPGLFLLVWLYVGIPSGHELRELSFEGVLPSFYQVRWKFGIRLDVLVLGEHEIAVQVWRFAAWESVL